MKRILDTTAGSRMMWFNKNHPDAVFCDIREEDRTLCNGQRLVVSPDVVADFRALPFPDESFYLVVFDPPHMEKLSGKSDLAAKYGVLVATWEEDLKQGFSECMRVLKPNGTLIFKWNDLQVSTNRVISVLGQEPLFGHTSGKHGRTKWFVYMK